MARVHRSTPRRRLQKKWDFLVKIAQRKRGLRPSKNPSSTEEEFLSDQDLPDAPTKIKQETPVDPDSKVEGQTQEEEDGINPSDMNLSRSSHSSDSDFTVYNRAYNKNYIHQAIRGKSTEECETLAEMHADKVISKWKYRKCCVPSDSTGSDEKVDQEKKCPCSPGIVYFSYHIF